MTGLIVEVALNGETSKARNPAVPRTPVEVAADGLACLREGAAILHTHTDDPMFAGHEASDRYGESWAPILAENADAILCPTMTVASTIDDRTSHFEACARNYGAKMAPLDPGSMNMPISGGSVDEVKILPYINTFDDIAFVLDRMGNLGLGASIGIYEPGFLRAVVAFHKAGRLPPGSFIKLYFFGGLNYFDGAPCVGFGLDPTEAALDAYLQILEGTALPWAATVVGGCLFESGMARMAVERGGHVRLGLEDYAGSRTPTNAELIREVAGLSRAMGRPLASPREASQTLGLP